MGATPQEFQRSVLERATAFHDGLPASLREPFGEMLRTRRYLLVDDPPDYFNPLATPLLQLPIWLADRLDADGTQTPDSAVLDAAEAALTGYFLIRVHDDFCDEEIGDPRTVLFLSAALQARMDALFGRVVPAGSRFWELSQGLFAEYGDAMLLEHRLHGTAGVRDLDTLRDVLRRSQLLVLAGAAILARAGRWALFDQLSQMVQQLVLAVQLYNDAFDAEEDQKRGTLTFAVCRFGGDEDGELMRKRLLAEGGLDQMVDEAIEAVRAAWALAREMGLLGAEQYFEARVEAMDSSRKNLFASVFARLLGLSSEEVASVE